MKAGLREPRIHTEHSIMLADIRRYWAMRNNRYIQGRTQWPICRSIHRPQSEQEAKFYGLAGAVYRAPLPMTVRTDWIFLET